MPTIIECPYCEGSGKINDEVCANCKGCGQKCLMCSEVPERCECNREQDFPGAFDYA